MISTHRSEVGYRWLQHMFLLRREEIMKNKTE